MKQAGGPAKFHHVREPAPIEKQEVVRMNRDTLYRPRKEILDGTWKAPQPQEVK